MTLPRGHLAAALLLLFTAATAQDNSFEGCLRRDSISCVQMHVYRKLRALFAQDSIGLLAGFSLQKLPAEASGDDGRGMGVGNTDDMVLGEYTVSERQLALEDFLYDKVSTFFKQRSFQWNLSPALEQMSSTAKMALDSIPNDVRQKATTYIAEARGRKKILKSLIPILVATKLKLVAFFTLLYVVIVVVAKKALVASVIALAITLFISIKKILAKHHHPHYYETHEAYHGPVHGPVHSPVHGPSPGWNSGSWSGWDSYDLHGAHSAPSTHHLAYSAQKPTHR